MGIFGQAFGQSAGQAAGNAGFLGLGLLMQRLGASYDRKQQLKTQQKLMGLQMGGEKEMTDYNMQKQLEMWEATSYGAQLRQMQKAGLNPAMMYGMGGGGGQTADIKQGNVTGGNAGYIDTTGMGLQLGMQMRMQEAQIEQVKAQTAKTKAETGAIPTTVEKTKAETSSIMQNINNAKAQEEYTKVLTGFQELETQFATESYRSRLSMIDKQLDQAIETIKKIGLENKFTEQTWNDAAKEIAQKAIQAELHNELLKVQTKAQEKGIQVQSAQIAKIAADIAQGWEGLRLQELQGQRETIKLRQADLQLLLNEIKTKFEISHPGLWNVIGGTLEETIKETVQDIQNKLKRLIPKP